MTLSDSWIEWKWSPEKTYPETLDASVEVMFRDEVVAVNYSVDFWHDDHTEDSSWFNTLSLADDRDYANRIIAYKLATPSETA